MSSTFVLILGATAIRAAPIDNSTAGRIQPEPPWVPSPRGRGTIDLLFTCVITLIICVWTAIHPNILLKPSLGNRLKNKARYVILGLFSPEIILALAFNEWREARQVLAAWREAAALGQLEKEVAKAEKLLEGSDRSRGEDPQGTTAGSGDKAVASSKSRRVSDSGKKDMRVKGIQRRKKDVLSELARAVKNGKAALGKDKTIVENDSAKDKSKQAERGGGLANTGEDGTAQVCGGGHEPRRSSPVIEDNIEADPRGTKDNDNTEAVTRERTLTDKSSPLILKDKKITPSVMEKKSMIKATTAIKRQLDEYDTLDQVLDAARKSRAHEMFFWVAKAFRCLKGSKEEFGMEGAFFAVMGGYTFQRSPNDKTKCTLSADGVIALLEIGVLTPEALAEYREEIKDKGKSDMLAKLLVITQASWMAINCLLRKAAGLPITIIELNVIVHVLIAVAVYACWWKKPHDAGTGITLNGQAFDEQMCAILFALHRRPGITLYTSEGLGVDGVPTELDFRPHHVSGSLSSDSQGSPSAPSPGNTTSRNTSSARGTEGTTSAKKSDDRPLIYKNMGTEWQAVGPPKGHMNDQHKWPQGVLLLPDHVLVDKEHGVAILADPQTDSLHSPSPEPTLITMGELKLYHTAAIAMRTENYSEFVSFEDKRPCLYPQLLKPMPKLKEKKSRFQTKQLNKVLIPLCLIYSGLHASLWNSYFPTPMERVLWRISSVIVGFPFLGAGAIWGMRRMVNPRSRLRDPRKLLLDLATRTAKASSLSFLVVLGALVPLAALGGIIYGAILAHPRILALKIHMAFRIELYSDLVIAVACSTVACLIASVGCLGMAVSDGREVASELKKGLTYLIAMGLVLAYCSARTFIFVETFVCLRRLPPGSYQTVFWEDFFPHL